MFLCWLFPLGQSLDQTEIVLLLGFDEIYEALVSILHSEEGGIC